MSFFVGNAKLKNGTIDNTVIGGTTAAAATVTTLTANTKVSATDIDGATMDIDATSGALTIDATSTIGNSWSRILKSILYTNNKVNNHSINNKIDINF